MDVNRPASKSQSSRKGKKTWRKNIDIDDIEVGLAEKREELIQHGQSIDEIKSEDLFVIDDEADVQIAKKLKRDNIKTLKATEILNQRSKAPALEVERNQSKKRKIQGVDKSEVHRLMKLAGKVKGESKTLAAVNSDGIIKNKKAYDLWNEEEPVKKTRNNQREVPEILQKFSGNSWTPATVVPKTLKTGPIRTRLQEKVPHGGKSYNPSFDKWQELINSEFFREKTKEDQRIALEEHRTRIQYLIEHLYDNEVGTSGSESEEEEEEERGEGEEEDTEESTDKAGLGLSVNKPTVTKRKTIAQRNKEKRHKERMALEDDLKELKMKIKQLENLPKISTQVIEEEEAKLAASLENDKTKKEITDISKLNRGKKKLFKYNNIEQKVEVKLSSELNDSLRKLKPESNNLFYDSLKNLQDQGKIETRIATKQKKKYSPKITEKWTYKDFK